MFGLALAGVLIGIIISMPVGPLAALSGLYWMEARRREAMMVAGGAIAGDAVLALVISTMFRMPLPIEVPYWLVLSIGLVVMVGMAILVWNRAEQKTLPRAEYGGFGGAMAVGLTHPGNSLSLTTLFATLLPVVSGLHITGLGNHQMVVLMVSLVVGKVLAWSGFLAFVDWCFRRYGEIPARLRRRLGQAVSAFMLLAAGGMALDLLQVLFRG